MSKYSIVGLQCINEGYILDRTFQVFHGSDRLFRVEAYSGNCCGISTIVAVNGYVDLNVLRGGLEYVANHDLNKLNLPWKMRSFFYYGNECGTIYHERAKAFGMEEVFRFPSRSEPGHDVVQYFVDFGATETVEFDDEEDDE